MKDHLNLVRVGLLGAFLIAGGDACASSARDNTNVARTVATASTQDRFNPTTNGDYPELSQAGLLPKTTLDLATSTAIPTRVFNYTDFQLNKDTLEGMYKFFEDYSKRGISRQSLELRSDLNLRFRGTKARSMVVISKDMPLPKGATPFDSSGTSLNKDYTTTFIRADVPAVPIHPGGLFSLKAESATNLFGVEICNEVIDVQAVDKNGKPIVDKKTQLDGQQIICDSYGYAIAASSLGWSYDDYRRKLALPLGEIGTRTLLGVDEATYNSMPKTGPAVSGIPEPTPGLAGVRLTRQETRAIDTLKYYLSDLFASSRFKIFKGYTPRDENPTFEYVSVSGIWGRRNPLMIVEDSETNKNIIGIGINITLGFVDILPDNDFEELKQLATDGINGDDAKLNQYYQTKERLIQKVLKLPENIQWEFTTQQPSQTFGLQPIEPLIKGTGQDERGTFTFSAGVDRLDLHVRN